MSTPEIFESLGVNAISLHLDDRVYSISVIARAAFRFSDRASCLLSRDERSTNSVCATFFAKHDAVDLHALLRDFADELLDQKLRQHLETQFGDLRLIITAQAFAEGNLLNPEDDAVDPKLDPRSIAIHR